MTPIRLGAVDYLNARPLVYGLDRHPERFEVRFDVPSKCAALLHEGAIDLGLIPSIEYLHCPDYHIVPDVSIASCGPVASVALFTKRPRAEIESVAVDSSSRTSVALLRVLCARSFGIEARFTTMAPDLETMIESADAALLIGDKALFTDHRAAGLEKIDLGQEWTALTGLPFTWAFWAGRPEVADHEVIRALQAARDEGVANSDAVAGDYSAGHSSRAAIGRRYLRDNVRYGLDDPGKAALKRFYDDAVVLNIVPTTSPLRFY